MKPNNYMKMTLKILTKLSLRSNADSLIEIVLLEAQLNWNSFEFLLELKHFFSPPPPPLFFFDILFFLKFMGSAAWCSLPGSEMVAHKLLPSHTFSITLQKKVLFTSFLERRKYLQGGRNSCLMGYQFSLKYRLHR